MLERLKLYLDTGLGKRKRKGKNFWHTGTNGTKIKKRAVIIAKMNTKAKPKTIELKNIYKYLQIIVNLSLMVTYSN